MAQAEAEAGMVEMSKLYHETGRQLYMGAEGGGTISNIKGYTVLMPGLLT